MSGGDAEIQANGFGMSDVKVSVRFRRETCLYLSVVLYPLFKSFSTICSEVQPFFSAFVSSLFISAIMLLLFVWWRKIRLFFIIVISREYIRSFLVIFLSGKQHDTNNETRFQKAEFYAN